MLISTHDDDLYSTVNCLSAAAVGKEIRKAAERVGWQQLRLPIRVGGRSDVPVHIPEELKSLLVEIIQERNRHWPPVG